MFGLDIHIKVVIVYTALPPDLVEVRLLQLESSTSVFERVQSDLLTTDIKILRVASDGASWNTNQFILG